MLNTIKAFTQITDLLATAGQPSAEAIPALRSAGFERVINLGLLGQPYSLPDEHGLVESLGMAYRHIPVPFEAPGPAHFAALYGFHRLGWDRARAEALLAKVWIPNPVWRSFLDEQFGTHCYLWPP